MCISIEVNVEKLKFYKPSMVDEDKEGQSLPSIEYCALDANA